MKIWLDSETYSEVDLKKHGIMNYTLACKPILITYAFDDAEIIEVWQEGEPLPQELISAIEAGHPVYAHNALFDYLALRKHLPLKLSQMRDTMALCTANHLPASLDQAGELLGIENKKLKSGTALIRKFCMPNKAGNQVQPLDFPTHWSEFVQYAVYDVIAMREVARQCRDLSEREWEMWQMTQRMNLRGVPVNVENAKHFMALASEVKVLLNKELHRLTGVPSASQVANLSAWLMRNGQEMPDMRADTVTNTLALPDLAPNVRKVLEIRKQGAMTAIKKYDVIAATAYQNRIFGAYSYHFASTGRYSSKGGLNLQNVPRGSESDPIGTYDLVKTLDVEEYDFLYGLQLNTLASIIRPTIEAPKGKKFVNYDYSSIENRCAPWIAGEMNHLELFRNNLDEYKDFAVDMFGVKYEDVTKDQRTASKAPVLGCGFGSGAKGLQGYAAGMGIDLELEECERLVGMYRKKHPKVKQAWYDFGSAAMQCVMNPNTVERLCRCAMKYDGHSLRLQLPSKRVISWYAPRIEKVRTPWGEMRNAVTVMMKPKQGVKYVRQALIGSSIFQSAVQATARDILVEAMYKLEKAGYEIVLTTHDEVMAEVDEEWDNTAEFEAIMTEPPVWGQEIPLAVEGWVGKNYRK